MTFHLITNLLRHNSMHSILSFKYKNNLQKDQEKIAAEKVTAFAEKRKAAKVNCHKIFKRAETYVKKYRATESQELRLRRQAKATGNFYVPSEPNWHLLFKSKAPDGYIIIFGGCLYSNTGVYVSTSPYLNTLDTNKTPFEWSIPSNSEELKQIRRTLQMESFSARSKRKENEITAKNSLDKVWEL
ncbi:hypothetical protein Glove_79g83 [Diversispora epigaea]|uniref:Large ribosomal subunit protein uL30 N-terminal eukaryotes domain-containing protein n=1 Tax=Diversispora epigaea TaxID=1348612 RepID=A0A397JI00_9GLOM|nr:hypothetical protein Glove_79g83 [Diversispora epigaea]